MLCPPKQDCHSLPSFTGGGGFFRATQIAARVVCHDQVDFTISPVMIDAKCCHVYTPKDPHTLASMHGCKI